MPLSQEFVDKPQSPDRGNIFFPLLELLFDFANTHTHDGANSKTLAFGAQVRKEQFIAAGGWTPVAGQAGTYKQTVAMPAGVFFDKHSIEFQLSDGVSTHTHFIYPTIERVSNTSYDIFVNDNSITLRANYSG